MKKTLGGGLFRLPKKYLFLVILILFLFISSFSYAYWKYSDTQDLVNVVGTKCLQLTMHNETDGITITDAAPMSDAKGKAQEGYTFTIKNTCNTIAYYQVNLEEELENNIKRLSNEYIKVSLNESEGKLLSKYEEVDTTIKEEDFTSDESHKLTSDRLNPNEEKEYTLKLWMADSTPAIEEVMDATFESKVSIIAVSKEEEELENTITISYEEPEYYSKDSEEVNITATSENYNLIEYSLDKEVWNPVEKEGTNITIKLTYNEEGRYKIYFKDEAGNIGEQDIVTNKLDQTPPTINIEETSDENGAVLNITFNDEKSGLYEYKIEDEVSRVDIEEGWTEITNESPKVIYKSQENKTIQIFIKDKVGNEKSKEYQIEKADITPPNITYKETDITKQEEYDWYQNLSLEATVTDNMSEIKSLKYCIATEESCEPDKEITLKGNTYKIELKSNEQAQKVCMKAIDNSANENESPIICSNSYKVDTSNPNQEFSINPINPNGNSDWYKTSPTITVTTSDDASGVSNAKYCTTMDSTKTCNPEIMADLTTDKTFIVALGNNANAQRVCVEVTDNSGRKSDVSCSNAYKVDVSDPSSTFSINPANPDGTNSWYKTSPTITITTNDDASGVASAKYCTTTSTTEVCKLDQTASLSTGTTSRTFTVILGSNANAQRVCVEVTDNAGRKNTGCSSTYKVDTSEPIPKISASSKEGTITINGADSTDLESKIVKYEYSKDNTTWYTSTNGATTSTYSFNGYNDGTYTVYLRVTNGAGKTKVESTSVVVAYQNVYISSSGNDSTGDGSRAKPYFTLAKAYSRVGSGGNMILLSNITTSATANFNTSKKSVTLKSDGTNTFTITKASTLTTEIIVLNSTNTLTTNNVVYDGNNVSSTTPVITVTGTSTINLNSGVTIKRGANTKANSGGGINILGNSTLNMTGATITSNKSNNQGGGVYINTATFNFNSGTISSNTLTSDGGGAGAFVWKGTMNMKGGTISQNHNGNGIYGVSDGSLKSTITITGGTISDNTATWGSGIGIYNSNLIYKVATMQNNTATEGGGAVNCDSNSTCTFESGTIQNNKATRGGAVHVSNSSTANLNGATISNNTATDSGGAFAVYTGCNFNMNSGTVSGNTASSLGGGVLLAGATGTISNGTIQSNTANYGGGVIVTESGSLTMKGGNIQNNTATSNSGGVDINAATFNLQGGTITGNKCNSSSGIGGVAVCCGGTYNKTGGTVSGNTPRNT